MNRFFLRVLVRVFVVQKNHPIKHMEHGELFSGKQLAGLRRRLLNWFVKYGRRLPWRPTDDQQTGEAYRIWISEIMLQQTTVVAVIPFYEKFLHRFPTVEQLAAASEEEVLRYWEGLGYYSRARNIHKTSQIIAHEHGGQFPETVDELVLLPGIGRYTAGAIVSFAWNRPAPIVEANTLRLYCRLLGYDGDPRASAGQKILWEFAERLVSPTSPGRCNQALMELGSLVCRSSAPLCGECPVQKYCGAFRDGTVDNIPVPKARPVITPLTEVAIAIRHGDRYFIRRNGDNERWAGLWDFPRFDMTDFFSDESNSSRKKISKQQLKRLQVTIEQTYHQLSGMKIQVNELLAEIRHSVTRYRIRLLCFHGEQISGKQTDGETFRWVEPNELIDFPLSVTGRQLAEKL